ncbi:crotonase/enoyl-CoA hydratase family protein [Streptomyces sp. AJS327]|nr:crotonase/enoyl-CoA hydratase family protein [Streptomyces sp. AJS327]
MSQDEPLLVERSGHIETWTLNRPDQRNPITDSDMIAALLAAVRRVDDDPDVRAVVLTGAGPAFSAGGNIKEIRARGGMFGAPPYQAAQMYRDGVQTLARAVFESPVPMIAAVNGAAVGAGCDLALMCDLRVAADDAFFAESFVKLGLISGDGGAWLLQRAIGPARAAEMTLTGDRVDAATALAWGLVSQVHPRDQLLAAATTLAERVAVNPPLAVRAAKRLLRRSESVDLAGALDIAANLQALMQHTEDHRRAVDGTTTFHAS